MKIPCKIIKKWILFGLAIVLLTGCEKTEIEQPTACLDIFNSTTGNILKEPFTAMINQSIVISSRNKAQLYAFYPGTEGKEWQGKVTPENEGLSSSNGSFTISYGAPGEYRMTLILTNRGDDYMEYKRDVVSSTMTISDNNAELVAFDIELSSGTVINGIPQGDEFIFNIPEGIGLSNVIPQYQTGTDYSTVFLNGMEIENGITPVDLTQSAVVTVTAYDGTEKEYSIVINNV